MISNESLAIFKDIANFSILREAIDRAESRQLAETTLIAMIKSAEAFKKQLSPDELLSPLGKELETIEYFLQELLQYFMVSNRVLLKPEHVTHVVRFVQFLSNDLLAHPLSPLNKNDAN